MNPFFVTDFSISDSLKTVRKSVLIYETIIAAGQLWCRLRLHRRQTDGTGELHEKRHRLLRRPDR